MSTLTQFGKEIRKLRIERGETMLDMSQKIGKSPSFLSAVETGRKPVPAQLVADIAAAYQLSSDSKQSLQVLAERSMTTFKIEPKDESEHALVAAFARKLDSLDDEQRQKILRILKA
ncbi:Helix-turn-helix domain protein [Caballeronia turbans]|nr:Helix-turn-helix domain protein [Caballeronia turbans]